MTYSLTAEQCREYALDMLSQLAGMSRAMGDTAFANLLTTAQLTGKQLAPFDGTAVIAPSRDIRPRE